MLFVYSLNAFDFLWSAGSSENPSPAHVGKILSVGDGVVTVSGLDKGRSGEMVLFENPDFPFEFLLVIGLLVFLLHYFGPFVLSVLLVNAVEIILLAKALVKAFEILHPW